jgi:hypothetical protein
MSRTKFIDNPKAKHFQIRFVKDRCGSYFYFSALPKEDIGKKAAEVASVEYLQAGYDNSQFRSFGYFKPIKTAQVVQWDRDKKAAMKGGIKFKIRLNFFQAIYMSGRKTRDEWYEADEIPTTKLEKQPLK